MLTGHEPRSSLRGAQRRSNPATLLGSGGVRARSLDCRIRCRGCGSDLSMNPYRKSLIRHCYRERSAAGSNPVTLLGFLTLNQSKEGALDCFVATLLAKTSLVHGPCAFFGPEKRTRNQIPPLRCHSVGLRTDIRIDKPHAALSKR